MRVQTFMGKVGIEELRELDDHINNWLEEHNVEPKKIQQTFGYETIRSRTKPEPVLIMSVWY